MKNIYEILKSIGIEIPEDKKEAFDKELVENYKTIAEVDGIRTKLSNAESERDTYKNKYDTDIQQRDTDLANLKSQLEAAGADKTKLDELTTKFSNLQSEYNNAKTEYEKNLASQKYKFLVTECANAIKFSSNSAKKTFIADVIAKNLPVEDDKLLGFDDFVNAYKQQDAGAFVIENPQPEDKPKPQFGGRTNLVDGAEPSGAGGTQTEAKSTLPSSIW